MSFVTFHLALSSPARFTTSRHGSVAPTLATVASSSDSVYFCYRNNATRTSENNILKFKPVDACARPQALPLWSLSGSFRYRSLRGVSSINSSGSEPKVVESSLDDSTPHQHVISDDKSCQKTNGASPPKRSAKIHDFCFGIPFGFLVICGGIVNLVVEKNFAVSIDNILYGGLLVSLGFVSLQVWKKGKSNLLFIFGQTVLATLLSWNHFHLYLSSKHVFPHGFLLAASLAMLCFYTYVMISGGNPPPKKLKLES